jgi:hypothetical protein
MPIFSERSKSAIAVFSPIVIQRRKGKQCVVGYEVEQQFEATLMGGREQFVEISRRMELSIDVGIIGNVVAEIGHRRRKIGDCQIASMPNSTR